MDWWGLSELNYLFPTNATKEKPWNECMWMSKPPAPQTSSAWVVKYITAADCKINGLQSSQNAACVVLSWRRIQKEPVSSQLTLIITCCFTTLCELRSLLATILLYTTILLIFFFNSLKTNYLSLASKIQQKTIKKSHLFSSTVYRLLLKQYMGKWYPPITVQTFNFLLKFNWTAMHQQRQRIKNQSRIIYSIIQFGTL